MDADRGTWKMTCLPKAALAAAVMLVPAVSRAADSFTVMIDAGGVSTTTGTKTLTDFIDLGLTSAGYQSLNSGYSDTAPADVNLDFRGLPMSVVYPDDGPGLVFSVPALGFSKAFNADPTRDGNEDALTTFLETDQEGLLTRILNYFVSETGTDPVAGNPTSLQANMIAADFGIGTGLGADGSSQASGEGEGGEEGRRNVYGLGARLGQYQVNGNDITTINLPLTFVRPLSDPRYALIIDVPLTFSETNGSQSYAASLGVGMRVPITTNWTLTPVVRVGATGSVDLGSLAGMYSATLSSSYKFAAGSTEINIGNMLGYISTAGSDSTRTVDDFEINYDLQNTVTRNGIGISGPLTYELFGQKTTWQAAVVNTLIFGDDVYIDNYTDMAFSVGTKQSRNGLTWDSIRIGFTYTVGNEGFHGGRINFGYQF